MVKRLLSLPLVLALGLSLLVAAASSCTKDPKDYPNLKIKDLKVGKGESVGGFDTIYVHFVGRFPNGKVFDQTKPGEKPRRYSMRAKTLLEGWRIGLVGMRPGGKRQLKVPPELAYGKKGKGARIPPNATLIFDIELVEVR